MTEYQTKARRILKDCGAFQDGGHYVYSSGLHGDFYINKDALYAHPMRVDDICVMMAQAALTAFGRVFDVVVAPATSGIAIGQAIAYNLSLDRQEEVLFAFAERTPDNRWVMRRGFKNVVKNRTVLLVDDVVTTGQTLANLAQLVTQAGGRPYGAVAICDRGGVRVLRYMCGNSTAVSEITIAPLVELDLKTFQPQDCPFCKSGRPINTELGYGVTYQSPAPAVGAPC